MLGNEQAPDAIARLSRPLRRNRFYPVRFLPK